jgi:hypothetical protein
VVCIEGISVPIERGQVTVASCPSSSIHRSVLLMAKHDSFRQSTFSVCLEALRADRLLLIALELALATGQAEVADTLARGLLRDDGKVVLTNQSVTDR